MALLYRYVTSQELGNCPCAVDCETGMIEVNRDVWNHYDEFERRFLIAHEEGHYYLDTDDEYEADLYALKKVAGTAPKSLARSVGALLKVGVIDEGRYYRIYEEALKIDKSLGNKEADKELKKIDNMSKQRNYRRADGEYACAPTEKPTEKKERNSNHVPNGLVIGNWYFSFTNILLIVIAIMLYNIIKK